LRHGRQEQVRNAHEPTGDFSLSLLPQRKKKRLVNGGKLGYVSGIDGDIMDVMDVMPDSRK
jgi:hypothetical protein